MTNFERMFMLFGTMFFSLVMGGQVQSATGIGFLGGLVAATGVALSAVLIGGPGYVSYHDLDKVFPKS
jgi:hypothetical protein